MKDNRGRTMAKKEYISSLKILELKNNVFAEHKLNQYKDWWKQYCKEFLGQKVVVDGKNCHSLQREYADNSQLSKYKCNSDSIPYIEITPLYRKAKDGLLFVNCNPSGTDYPYYQKHNGASPTDFFYYDRPDNTYFNAVVEFANGVGGKGFGNFAMIDVFPIVIQNQAVLKKAFGDATGDLKEAFDKLIEFFLDSIRQIKPKVVIVTNAFVKDLFEKKFDGRIDAVHDDNNVCYHIEIDNFKTTVFCGGMIAGGHQMDTESKKRLIRDVNLFMKSSIGCRKKL